MLFWRPLIFFQDNFFTKNYFNNINLDLDQALQNVDPDLDPNCMIL